MAKFGGSGIGGILGDIVGLGGAALFPELGIPALAASAGGSALGSTIGGLASGEKLGPALLGGAESGALAGLTTGAGELLAGEPLLSTASPFTGILGSGAGGTGAAADAGTAATTAGLDTTPLSAGATTPVGPAAAPLGGSPSSGFSLGGGGDPSSLAGNVGSGNVDLSQAIGAAGPNGNNTNFLLSTSFGDTAPNLDAAPGSTFASSTASSDNIANNLNYLSKISNLPGGGDTGGTALIPSGSGVVAPSSSPDSFLVPGTDTPITGGTPGTIGAGTGTENFGDKLLKYVTDNPGILLGGGILGSELLSQRNAKVPGIQPLQQNAASLQQNAATLSNFGNQALSGLTTGQVPPGAQSLLDETTNAAKAQVRSQYANLGLAGSTMESDKLAEVDQNAAANKWQIIQGLISSGLNATSGAAGGLTSAGNELTTIMNAELNNDKATQDALARFAAALAGGTGRSAAA